MAMAAQTQDWKPTWKLPAVRSPPISPKPAVLPATSPTKHSAFAQARKQLEESRRLFLHQQDGAAVAAGGEEQTSEEANARRPAKKISFKVRKNASIYRRKAPDAKPLNLVQELTKRYNELDEQRSGAERSRPVKRSSQNLKRRPSAADAQRARAEESAGTSVRAAIAIFEQKCASGKPQVAAKTFDARAVAARNQERRLRLRKEPNNAEMPRRNGAAGAIVAGARDGSSPPARAQRDASPPMDACETPDELLQVVSLPMATLKRCESNYECQKFGRAPYQQLRPPPPPPQQQQQQQQEAAKPLDDGDDGDDDDDDDDDYETVRVPPDAPPPAKRAAVPPLPPRSRHKFAQTYARIEDDYEIPQAPADEENIYESLSRCSRHSAGRDQREPLPPRPPPSSPPASSSPSVEYESDASSNYYESICSKRDESYESIYGGSRLEGARTRASIAAQSDQQTNSIYGRSITSWAEEVFDIYLRKASGAASLSGGSGKAASELSGSSDDWVDISDHEQGADGRGRHKFVIVREARHQKATKKNSGWSQRIRGQWNKVPKKMHHGDTDSDHTYETLYGSDGLPIGSQTGPRHGQSQPQHPPQSRHRPSDELGGHLDDDDDDDFDSFESDCESDNSFAKTDSGVDMGNTQLPDPPAHQTYAFTRFAASAGKNVMNRLRRNWSMRKNDISKSLSRITKRKSMDPEATPPPQPLPPSSAANQRKHAVGGRGFLDKFKRSMSMTGDVGDHFSDRPTSTFYVTDPIDLDSTLTPDAQPAAAAAAERPERKPKPHLVRPQMPPPPTPPGTLRRPSPAATPRSRSWYAECGVFKADGGVSPTPALPRRPNSFWYAEVGLYQSGSPPSTGTTCSENSGTSTNSADAKKDEAFNSLQGDIQLRLQDEPLYQFYDAAVLESVCNSGLSDVYDDYEEIAADGRASFSPRPTAMEIVSPRNNVSVARTLWCEIPEVVQSAVLSTLSAHQRRLQEAKFEMLTSEASYLNSLHVLTEHFVRRLRESELLNDDDKETLCGKILPVKECSERLLGELERCWQENILLHGVCEIVKRHAEEGFGVYVAYCENQILLDHTLKGLKERSSFMELLRQLEANSVCQLLTLHSFLMLPMQRITRWPLLVDAILKRLSPQDEEYQNCQYALATLNKIVTQCNEGARNMERIAEMRKLAAQMEFGRSVPPMELVNGRRWLVRSGPLTQMLNRGDDVKLTFGKRFTKIPIHLFLFNDSIVVAKSKGDGVYVVQHYCSRSYVELNGDSLAALPTKDTHGRHLIFLTILENHEEKTVEMLLSCASESDRERWLEALTPPKSENPEETLYECWDCPQVTAVHNYTANQPDELPITRGDVINVTRKMADGWYHGERIRDGEAGWFPANYTVEVANPHVRARNLKQRYRLLAYSENYLKSK